MILFLAKVGVVVVAIIVCIGIGGCMALLLSYSTKGNEGILRDELNRIRQDFNYEKKHHAELCPYFIEASRLRHEISKLKPR